MVTAVVLSGGTGTRLGMDIPKQYIEVGGERIITRSLRTFALSNHVDQIVIVADPKWQEDIVEDVKKADFSFDKFAGFALPGETRQYSVYSALRLIIEEAQPGDLVLVHDAARPMLTEATIQNLIDGMKEHDGAMPVLPMKDTVYQSCDGKSITSLLDRKTIFAGQAPEIFDLEKYYDANARLDSQGILIKVNGSTEAAILGGMDIAMVPGDEGNFKITTKADLERFTELTQE